MDMDPNVGDTRSHRWSDKKENVRAWEQERGTNIRRQKESNQNALERNTEICRSQHKEHGKAKESKRSAQKYRRKVRCRAISRTKG